jgi:hypothetical protein
MDHALLAVTHQRLKDRTSLVARNEQGARSRFFAMCTCSHAFDTKNTVVKCDRFDASISIVDIGVSLSSHDRLWPDEMNSSVSDPVEEIEWYSRLFARPCQSSI